MVLVIFPTKSLSRFMINSKEDRLTESFSFALNFAKMMNWVTLKAEKKLKPLEAGKVTSQDH